MDPLAEAAASLLKRHPSPALSMEELQEFLDREDPFASPNEDQLVTRLGKQGEGLRVLVRPKRRWVTPIGPSAWIFAESRERVGASGPRSATHLLRSTLVSLGSQVEPGSAQQWARWTRFLLEEARVRASLGQATDRTSGEPPTSPGARSPGTRPSTTPLRDPPRPTRVRIPPRTSPSRPLREGGSH